MINAIGISGSYNKINRTSFKNRRNQVMSLSVSPNSHFNRTLSRMLGTKLRIDPYFPVLTVLLSTSRNHVQEPRIDRKNLLQFLEKENSTLNIFKLSMLMHHCIMFGFVSDSDFLLNQLEQKLDTMPEKENGLT